MGAINTGKVKRRVLRFQTIDEAIAEGRRIARLAAENRIEYQGNWDASQILNHLGVWAEYAYKPNPLTPPWYIKVAARMLKGRFLNTPMHGGGRIPKVPNGTLATEKVPLDQAAACFEAGFARLNIEPPTEPSVLFGQLTQEEAIKMNLRHAELHMSFVKN